MCIFDGCTILHQCLRKMQDATTFMQSPRFLQNFRVDGSMAGDWEVAIERGSSQDLMTVIMVDHDMVCLSHSLP